MSSDLDGTVAATRVASPLAAMFIDHPRYVAGLKAFK